MTIRLITRSKRASHYNWIVEDPDPARNRIFIENLAYDTDSLRARPNESFMGQGGDLAFSTSTDHSNYMLMHTNGKFWWGTSWARQDTYCVVGHNEPWFASLDYDRYPGKNNVISSNGYVNFCHYQDYSSYTGRSLVWIGTDMAGMAQYLAGSVGMNSILFYEDPLVTNEWYGIYHYSVNTTTTPHTLGPTIVKVKIYGGGMYIITGRSIPGHLFFVGRNSDSTALFVRIDGNTQSLDFYKCSSGAYVALTQSWVHPGPPIWHYQFPSNIRHDSERRKVFYQGGWDRNPQEEYKQPFFHRFVHDPVSGLVDIQPCVCVFPAGKTHNDYQMTVRYEPSYHGQYNNSWYYKPHQFTVNGTTYLTYMYIDRAAPSYRLERSWYYRRDRQNTWVTFTVGSGENDNVLTYHSTYTWEQHGNMVRYMMPINHIGNQLIVLRKDTMGTLTFDTLLGWIYHDQENLSVRGVAMDSVGRVYVGTTGHNYYDDTNAYRYDYNQGKGYGMLFEYIPNTPISIYAQTDQTTYTYSGSTIQSNIFVQARDSLNDTRVVANVRLVINGTNAKFSNNASNVVIATSSNANVAVPITITGAGRPTVTAHLIL